MIEILKSMNISPVSVTPFKSIEDGSNYEVWHIIADDSEYVLKKAKGEEISICSAFFSEPISGAPRFLKSVNTEDGDYFLMEYVNGEDLCKCTREGLKKALDALISIQTKYWNSEPLFYEKALESRINRGKYLFDAKLEEVYSRFLTEFEALPRTLCHDDLLPFNVLVSDKGATIIDWEVAGILPYPTSLARLIAHTENDPEYLFFMSDEDRTFAIEYYYENLVKGKGISYSDYRRSLDLFLFYEYCEWIMVGNKYADANRELFEKYKIKAKEHIKMMKESNVKFTRIEAYEGNSKAQYNLAKYCEEVDSDIEQAAFWYKKAALQDHDMAIEKCRKFGIDPNAPAPNKEAIRKELKCRIYPLGYLERYTFTVICANYQGKWILSKHKKRDTWETQGGHIEAGEDPLECARRELFEESGIRDADIYPVCDYWGFNSKDCSNGMVFLAVVHSLGKLPESEMKEIGIFDTLPEELTYPQVSPRLYSEAAKLLKGI